MTSGVGGGIIVLPALACPSEALATTVASGVYLGYGFRGRYRSQAGDVYDERSMTVHAQSLTKHELVNLGATLARELLLGSVLVKVDGGEVLLVRRPSNVPWVVAAKARCTC